jgi:hypothetical protein
MRREVVKSRVVQQEQGDEGGRWKVQGGRFESWWTKMGRVILFSARNLGTSLSFSLPVFPASSQIPLSSFSIAFLPMHLHPST